MSIGRALPSFALATVVATCALTLTIVPAQAASLSPAQVADAYSVMLTATKAELAGVSQQNVSSFGVANSTKGSPDAPWLCDLTGNEEIKGIGAADVISSEVLSLDGKNITAASQKIQWFTNEKKAKKAYDVIVQRIKSCEGQQAPAPDTDDSAAIRITINLTNGEKQSKDGDAFLWVDSQTTMTDPTTEFADHDYSTVRLLGKYIQVIEVWNEGNSAAPLSKKQIAAVDRLTDSLGDAWKVKFL
jgi:hypothetical protein